jgi:hypothetical protein
MAPDELLSDITGCGWKGQADAVYSIDVLVHVTMEHLLAYLITAAAVLKPGGKIVLTLANAASDKGFGKLLKDVARSYPVANPPVGAGRFFWLAPQIVETVLPRLGFEIDLMDDSSTRDLEVVGSLARPEIAPSLEDALKAAERPADG